MNHQTLATPRWSTSSFGNAADTSAASSRDLSGLREHLSLCKGARGRWFTLRCAVETMNGFVAGRFVTTLAVASLLIGATALLA